MVTATKAFGIILVLVISLIFDQVVPVVEAFTTSTSTATTTLHRSRRKRRSKESFERRRRCFERHHTKDNDDDDHDDHDDSPSRRRYPEKVRVSSLLTRQYHQQQQDRKRQVRRRQQQHKQQQRQKQRQRTLLQREATTTTTSSSSRTRNERNVSDAKKGEKTTTSTANNKITKHDIKWQQQFERLKAFRDFHGHCNVPNNNEGSLAIWINNQRTAFKKGKLRDDRKKQLKELGFIFWRLQDDQRWKKQYDTLKSYQKENGHCHVPQQQQQQSQGNLGSWVNTQRIAFKDDRLSASQINLLNEIGFVWNPLDETWKYTYRELKEFKQRHGHMNVPSSNGDLLSRWAWKQRLDQATGRMDRTKKAMLDDIGFVWEDPDFERYERQWLDMFRELEQYKLLHGHVRVPALTSKLGIWVSKQRVQYHDGHLLEHRQAKLESLGFVWRLRQYKESRDTTKRDEQWMEKYRELQEFQEEHGHVNVPYKKGALGRWTNTQRRNFRADKLRNDRIDLLEEVGFEWEPKKLSLDELWQAKYKELQSYQNEFGNLDVAAKENQILYNWISRQRAYQQAGRLGSKEKAMLDKLGIAWGEVNPKEL